MICCFWCLNLGKVYLIHFGTASFLDSDGKLKQLHHMWLLHAALSGHCRTGILRSVHRQELLIQINLVASGMFQSRGGSFDQHPLLDTARLPKARSSFRRSRRNFVQRAFVKPGLPAFGVHGIPPV
jgi:hypothetical protein